MTRYAEICAGCLLGGGLLFAFREPLGAMVNQWSANPMYSHGFTVPFISLGLLWSRRQQLMQQPQRPARLAALPILGFALLLFAAGEVAAVLVAQQLAFVLTIAGVVVFLYGFDCLRISAAAIAYLLFMIPFWDVFTEPLHAPFQHNSALLGTAIMRAAGTPAQVDGTIITLPNIALEVAKACSGVNYLIAVLALALPVSFVYLHTWWRRAALIVSALLIAILANGVRVALIGILAYFEIGSPLHGPFHVLQGLFVAGIGYVALFAGLFLLEESSAAGARTPAGSPGHVCVVGSRPSQAFNASGLAVAVWTLAFVGVAPVGTPVALAKPLDGLSHTLGAWRAEADPGAVRASAAATAWEGADQILRRRYNDAEGHVAVVEIWYFAEQRQDREVVSFRTAELHQRARLRRIEVPGNEPLTVNAVEWPDRREASLFWYELDGVPESRAYAAKLRSAWRALVSGRTNASAVMITTDTHGESAGALDTLAVDVHRGLSELRQTTNR